MLLFNGKCLKMFGNTLKCFNALIILMIYTSIYGNLLFVVDFLYFLTKFFYL